VTFRKYLVLAGVAVFAAAGDSLISCGMKHIGAVSLARLPSLILAVVNPSVALGVLFLLAFFASYMMTLSWADLTYVLPATSVGYVLLALIAKFLLHEHVSPTRWIGILLISTGVAFATSGPASTPAPRAREPEALDAEAVSVGVRR
jgi:drug/metabolite transporter (DMT)-like permease